MQLFPTGAAGIAVCAGQATEAGRGGGGERTAASQVSSFYQNLKWNVSVYSKNFGTKPKLFDVFQLLFCKSKTFLFFQKIWEQNQNFLMCSNVFLAKAKCYYIIKKILDLKENVLVR